MTYWSFLSFLGLFPSGLVFLVNVVRVSDTFRVHPVPTFVGHRMRVLGDLKVNGWGSSLERLESHWTVCFEGGAAKFL